MGKLRELQLLPLKTAGNARPAERKTFRADSARNAEPRSRNRLRWTLGIALPAAPKAFIQNSARNVERKNRNPYWDGHAQRAGRRISTASSAPSAVQRSQMKPGPARIVGQQISERSSAPNVAGRETSKTEKQ